MKAHLSVLISRQDFVHPLFTKQIILQIIRILAVPGRWSSVHPLQLLSSFLAGLFLLKALELL